MKWKVRERSKRKAGGDVQLVSGALVHRTTHTSFLSNLSHRQTVPRRLQRRLQTTAEPLRRCPATWPVDKFVTSPSLTFKNIMTNSSATFMCRAGLGFVSMTIIYPLGHEWGGEQANSRPHAGVSASTPMGLSFVQSGKCSDSLADKCFSYVQGFTKETTK